MSGADILLTLFAGMVTTLGGGVAVGDMIRHKEVVWTIVFMFVWLFGVALLVSVGSMA